MSGVSVCIPTYRGAERLRPLIESVGAAAGQLRAPCEVLICDDGSPPEDAAAIVKLGMGRLIQFRENRGSVAAQAALVRESSYEHIVLLDDDVLVPEDLLKTAVGLLSIPGIGVLSWRSKGIQPGQSQRPRPGFLQPATQLASYCMAFRRQVYFEVGGLDERFKQFCADSDFALRVTMHGHPSYRVWWPLVPHTEHASFSACPELDREGRIRRDLDAWRNKWDASGDEMERRALAALST